MKFTMSTAVRVLASLFVLLFFVSACVEAAVRAGSGGGDSDGDTDTDTDTDADADTDTDADADTDTDTDTDGDTDSDGDTDTEQIFDFVYAHSGKTLYSVHPTSFEITVVGDFDFPGYEQMTDIALDESGAMTGVSYDNVYAIDKETAACTLLTDLQGESFNGLSFLEDEDEQSFLVGAALEGNIHTVDDATGSTSLLGSYGGDLYSSGDLVYIRDDGAYATVTTDPTGTDLLASVDPATGEATIIGDTGFIGIYGLAYWGGQPFGFACFGEFILIDPEIGVGTLIEDTGYYFNGAGVTTIAPVIIE